MNRRRFLVSSLAALPATAALASAKPLRVAVIGHTGRGNYGHGLDTMWLHVPGVQIIGVADADPSGLAKAQEKLPGARGFGDYRQMLADLKPDMVAIGPRHIDQHRDMTLAAVEAGARGIYMEKPFCRTLAEADEIIAACQKHGTRLALAHRNRYHPVLPVIRDLVAQGAIGRLLEYRCRGKEDARGGGLDLWVLGSHILNLVHYFAGKPLACSATILQDGRPAVHADLTDGGEGTGPLLGNAIHARFDMEDGLPAYYDCIQNAGVKEHNFGLQLIGTQGTIDLRIDLEPLAHLLPASPYPVQTRPQAWIPITSAGPGKPEPIADIRQQVGGHLAPALDLIAAIKEDREPLCSAADGRVILEMTMGVFESHRLQGQRVPLPLAERGHPLHKLQPA